ncbi:hypothetical protein [Pseudogemmobacter faecipullorum]|uniref:Uncharacterized protein n=1 Tax=Pseudogemmobacter faecipullorum TaxID=2755041 RepID=A0ABS8CQP6_9RHOB|nr:hypothetical protein [Pseudogemmobacter faecipullorum]MCB5411722.1 hypothetical protein [Pseudogemmobacter faecipullorum]
MSKFSFKRDDEGSEGRRIVNHGEVPLKITAINAATNSVTGVDLRKDDGSEVTISMVSVGEYADFYTNRNRFTNAQARTEEASKQLAKQPTAKGLGRNGVEIGDVVQMQSVKELTDGKIVARWMNALTTDGQANDAYKRMQIQISIPKDNASTEGKYERRAARAFDIEATVPATREALESMTDGRVRRDDGRALEGAMRNSVLVAISDGVDTKSVAVDMGWDRQKNQPATGVEALFNRDLDNFNYRPMAALAGRVGVPFENLKFLDGNARNGIQDHDAARAAAQEYYDAGKRGDVGVTITPGFVGDLMVHIKQNIMAREQSAAKSSRAVSLSERGFFTADVAIMSSPERVSNDGEVRGPQSAFKQILPAEFLHPTADEKFVRRKASDLGHDAITAAMDKDRNAVFAPNPTYKPSEPAPKPEEPEKARSNELSPDY